MNVHVSRDFRTTQIGNEYITVFMGSYWKLVPIFLKNLTKLKLFLDTIWLQQVYFGKSHPEFLELLLVLQPEYPRVFPLFRGGMIYQRI